MIERQILKKKVKEYLLQEHIAGELPKGSYSILELKKTPLGEKVIIYTSRPGLVVGSKGVNINRLNKILKTKFEMENPEIEIAEIENPNLDPKSVAERIVSSFERFGPKRFKSMGYRTLQEIIDAGAIVAEIVISGRGVPSSRAKTWRFISGHLKKSGNVSENLIKRGLSVARLKSGSVGVKVSILTPDIKLPDDIRFIEKKEEIKEDKEKTEQEEVKKDAIKKVKKKDKKEENEKTPAKADG